MPTKGVRESVAVPTGFANYREKQGRKQRANICPSCKQKVKGGSVFIGMREKTHGAGSDKTLASHSIALCEVCCCSIYESLLGRFEAAVADGG